MAIALAMSCRLNCPGIPLALVTDSKDPILKDYYDIVIPSNPDYPQGIIHKIYMYDYSPFEETLFVDVDCLVMKDFTFLFDWFKESNVSAIGKTKNSGRLFGLDFEVLRERTGIDSIGAINGGVYYFKKNEKAEKVFTHAKGLYPRYDELGLDRLRGGFNEEGLMAISMAYYNEATIDDKGLGMRTPIGLTGQITMDVILQKCSFYKYNELVSPAIMHFGGDCTTTFFYRRELQKLKLAKAGVVPRNLISLAVNLWFNVPYGIYVFFYRIAKSMIKGAKFKLLPLLPMYKFE